MKPDRAGWLALTEGEPPEPRPWDAIRADHDRLAHQQGVRDLWIGGGEPTRSPNLLDVLRRSRDAGQHTTLCTDGRALGVPSRLDALRDAGAERIAVRLHGADAGVHDAAAGPGSWAAAVRALGHLASHPLRACLLVTPAEAPHFVALVDLAQKLGVSVQVVARVGQDGDAVASPSVAAALDAAWQRAAERGVTLAVDGLTHSAAPTEHDLEPPALDRNLAELFDRGLILPSTTTGLRALGHREDVEAACARGGPLPQLAPSLAAAGMPLRDLPACLGGEDLGDAPRAQGPGCTPCPRAPRCGGLPTALEGLAEPAPPPVWEPLRPEARVAVLNAWQPDKLLTLSALPGLARALEAGGARVELLGCWDFEPHPTQLAAPRPLGTLQRAWSFAYRTLTRRPDPYSHYDAPEGVLAHPLMGDQDEGEARRIDEAWWRDLDLAPYDAVVVAGWSAARRAIEHPTRRAGTRVVCADMHLLDGAPEWAHDRNPSGVHPSEGAWWPSDDLHVHSCFPRFQLLYRGLGVPLSNVHWRPYPLALGHAPRAPEPHEVAHLFTGGRHLRHLQLLAEARSRQAGPRPVRVVAPADTIPTLPGIEAVGELPLEAFWAELAHSRAVIVPMAHDVTRAAGISVIALAQAAGRPVVATRTPATLDHVRHGIDGLLVPAGDAAALADALDRLDDDDEVRRLGHGARAAGARLSVEGWAQTLLHGATPRGPYTAPGSPTGTRYAW